MTRRKTPKYRFVAAKSSPFTDDDAAVIGACLQRIAEANAVDGIRSLDQDLVLQEYEAGRAPELEPYLEQDQDEAQRQFWRTQIGQMIRSIRVTVLNVQLSRRPDPRPQFVTVKQRRGLAAAPIRSRVITEDAMAHDPVFASAFGMQVRIVSNAVRKLSRLVAMKKRAPPHMKALPADLQAVLDEYVAQLVEDAAE